MSWLPDPVFTSSVSLLGFAAGDVGPFKVHALEIRQLPDYGFLRGGVCTVPVHVVLLA